MSNPRPVPTLSYFAGVCVCVCVTVCGRLLTAESRAAAAAARGVGRTLMGRRRSPSTGRRTGSTRSNTSPSVSQPVTSRALSYLLPLWPAAAAAAEVRRVRR